MYDRGLLTQARIDALQAFPGITHLSDLRSTDIRGLLEGGDLQVSLFDMRNLREIASPDFPGERLIACFNPLLAEERRRTNVEKELLSAEDAVISYKSLSRVELAFRSLKGIDLCVRPIRHRTEDHVWAHFFLCMLSYYVEFHLRKALGELLFDDRELEWGRWLRDPVAPAKVRGFTAHSLETALAELGTCCRHTCSTPGSRCYLPGASGHAHRGNFDATLSKAAAPATAPARVKSAIQVPVPSCV